MIDTVRLRSPYLSDEQACLVEQQLKLRMAVDLKTGDKLYEITSDELQGSFDNRIMVRLCHEELAEVKPDLVSFDKSPPFPDDYLQHPSAQIRQARQEQVDALERFSRNLDRQGPAVKMMHDRERQHRDTERRRPLMMNRPCQPYLIVEGSVHKAMIGHNITGGPLSFQPAALWFVNLVAQLLWVTLPHGAEWFVERVDVTECYKLPYEAIEDFIGSLNRVEYPRRKRRSYGLESLQFGGTTTAFSLYHKGPEFAKHDGRKLRGHLSPSDLHDLQLLANGIMRMEVSVKGRKLRADAKAGVSGLPNTRDGEKLRVVQVTDAYLWRVHDQEVARVIREGQKGVETVRTEQEVSRRLFAKYHTQLAGSLYGLWVRLSSHGEKEVRKTMPPRTFYRQRAQLVKAGCSWAGTDIVIKHSSIPVGFSMRRTDPRCDRWEDPRITEMLAPYMDAA